jgi:hypothetical protein
VLSKGDNMKSIIIETLSGRKFFVDNVGSYFMVTDESMSIAHYFNTIAQCLDYVKSIA